MQPVKWTYGLFDYIIAKDNKGNYYITPDEGQIAEAHLYCAMALRNWMNYRKRPD